jgi:hypothetical protein
VRRAHHESTACICIPVRAAHPAMKRQLNRSFLKTKIATEFPIFTIPSHKTGHEYPALVE